MNGLIGSFVHHQADSFNTENICNLMRIHKHGGGAMRNNSPDELCDRQHARFNVHVPVHQTGNQKTAVSFNHFGLWAKRMRSIRADKGDASSENCDIRIWNNFTGLNGHPLSFSNDHICRQAAHGAIHQFFRGFCDCFYIPSTSNINKATCRGYKLLMGFRLADERQLDYESQSAGADPVWPADPA